MTELVVEELEFMTKSKFSKIVESVVLEKNMSYIDAVIYVCELNNIEIEDSRKYISIVVKQKIEMEAMQLNFLERNGTLPIDWPFL